MFMKKIILSFITVATLSSFSFAGGDVADIIIPVPVVVEEDNSDFYIGAIVSYQRTYSDKSKWFGKIDSQDETAALGLVAGYDFNEYIAIEARFAKSVFEEDYADVTTYSIFVKPQYPITEDFTIYALLGYGNATVKGTDAGGPEFGFDPNRVGYTIMDESGFQWGLGVSYALNEEIAVFFDYVSFASDADIDTTALYWYNGAAPYPYDALNNDALTLGVTYKF